MTSNPVLTARKAGLIGLVFLALLFVLPPDPVLAGPSVTDGGRHAPIRGSYSMEILVDGRPVPEFFARGATYVEALRGREYSIRLRNHTSERIAVALSVDGLNTIDAKTTPAREASKWILEPWGTLTLEGWQTSSSTARRFFFTSEERSYGAWLGRTRNFGLVSAAVYRELRPRPAPIVMPQEGGAGRRDSKGEQMRQEASPGGDSKGPAAKEQEPADPDGAGRLSGTAAEESRSKSQRRVVEPKRDLSDDYAATGIGRAMGHQVQRVHFLTEDAPAAIMEIRYEFRDALARLGVLPEPCARLYEDPLERRERSRGFDGMEFSPDPFDQRCR